MGIFRGMEISTSGLTAERLRMDTVSLNIANADTTRTEEGGPYRRKIALFEEYLAEAKNPEDRGHQLESQGVRAAAIVEDEGPLPRVYDPEHPDAGPDGYVQMPNVNILTEMIDMMASRRAYEANITALNSSKDMLMKTLEIGR